MWKAPYLLYYCLPTVIYFESSCLIDLIFSSLNCECSNKSLSSMSKAGKKLCEIAENIFSLIFYYYTIVHTICILCQLLIYVVGT